ncbi:MAG: endoglucanase A, partial [Myxococcales bacterium]|nr:endoglucanase A [Myxococcales bacterium]
MASRRVPALRVLSPAVLVLALACTGDDAGDDDVGEGTDGSTSDSSSDGSTGTETGTDTSSDTGVDPGPIIEPGDPGPADVTLEIRADTDQHPISPLIYGINGGDDLDGSQSGVTLLRSGGNRMTAYNWENNASNAGSDYIFQNDNFLVADLPQAQQDQPGAAVRGLVDNALAHDAAALLTIPICGYVAADKDGGGDVGNTPNYLDVRFHPTIAFKGAALSTTPDGSDDAVYQDEFVHWVSSTWPEAFTDSTARVLFSLDNEPDLWAYTHERIHPNPVGYQELVDKNTEFAAAVKSVAPNAWVTGFVSYGYAGYLNLQSAPDQSGEFIDFYLDELAAAEVDAGARLVDVLDLHWYPEATGNG